MGVYEVFGAMYLKNGLEIEKYIENALYLVVKYVKVKNVYKKPISIAKRMLRDFCGSI